MTLIESTVHAGLPAPVRLFHLTDLHITRSDESDCPYAVRQQAEQNGAASVQQQCEQLMAEWNDMEPRFLLYVRHDHLDNIMEHLSELSAYCLEDDRAELLSTLDAALRMMEHLKESVTPSFRTLL